MAACQRCGRELKDPSAQYGWRCAQVLGYTEGNPERKPDKWDKAGYRTAFNQANRYLDNLGMNPRDIDQTMYYDAFTDLMIAEYFGDPRAWEDAFWRIVTSLYPSFSDKGERVRASTDHLAMEIFLSLIQEIEGLNLLKSSSSTEQSELKPDISLNSDEGKVPRYSSNPINPLSVLDQMIAWGDDGSYVFWTEKLDALKGKSRMEVWTFPLDLDNVKEDGISFNFRTMRGTRTHAGLDINTKPNAPILAVTDGIVVYQGYFYSGKNTGRKVYQVMALNFDGSVVRYGEMHDLPIAEGTIIRQGDIVGYTKRMDVDRMLHIEVYKNIDELRRTFDYDEYRTGSGPYANVGGSGYERRSDLINPTMFGALGIYQGSSYDLTKRLSPYYDLIVND